MAKRPRLPKCPTNLKLSSKELGRGAYGAVREGTFKGRPVAVKTVHSEIARDKPLEDFIRECQLLASLESHPNIVQSYGAFESRTGEPMLVLERMKENLREYLQRNSSTLTQKRQLEICLNIASGLKFLHERNPPVAHRDVTDKNVLIGEDGSVRVSDLGQSKLLENGDVYMSTTAPGNVVYMPPEALKSGDSHFSVKVDVFSLGVLMLQIATRCQPTCGLVGIGTVPELERRRGDLSKLSNEHPLKPLIELCLKDDYKNRPDIRKVHDLIKSLYEAIQEHSTDEVEPWSSGTVVVGKYNFKATSKHDLPFDKGDTMTIVSATRDPNWYKAKREDGLEGLIPANFVIVSQNKHKPKEQKQNKEKSSGQREVKLTMMPWYHGKITREEAEALLTPKKNGLFLIRTSAMYPGDFVLNLCYNGKVEHYHIIFVKNQYTIDKEEYFENLTQLVEYYKHDADGLYSNLKEHVAKVGGGMEVSVDRKAFLEAGWSIPKRNIEFGSQIGKGEFGEVFQGEYKGQKVAIKFPNDNHKGLQALIEASVMTALQHENLIKLIGVSIDDTVVYILTEFMEKGALIEYLRLLGRAAIQKSHQIGFACDVSCGMAYLESKEIIHRDLAARNVLVAGNNTAKVSEFHLARPQNVVSYHGKIPVKWTAPEVFEREVSTKSDVWSFGILLWEIYTFGRVPYPRVPLDETIKYVKRGGRPVCPDDCPPKVYELMSDCWKMDPTERPNFKWLHSQLKSLPESA